MNGSRVRGGEGRFITFVFFLKIKKEILYKIIKKKIKIKNIISKKDKKLDIYIFKIV